jgi:ribosome-binding protein aMBF1 (putative translation factor)
MGWSQSDLARRLQTDCEIVKAWELGQQTPDFKTSQSLGLLFQQAEVTALDILNSVQAEVHMDQFSLEIVNIKDVLNASGLRKA